MRLSLVGGQFGSEGKGKVAHFLAREQNASVAVRVGGSNSGHTVIDLSGNPIVNLMKKQKNLKIKEIFLISEL